MERVVLQLIWNNVDENESVCESVDEGMPDSPVPADSHAGILMPIKCSALFALGRSTPQTVKDFMDVRIFPCGAEVMVCNERQGYGRTNGRGFINRYPHFHVSKRELEDFLKGFMDASFVVHYMKFGISVDDIYTRRFLFFAANCGDDATAFATNRLVQLLLSTDDVRYLEDIHRNLLIPIRKVIEATFPNASEYMEPLRKLPPNSRRFSEMADAVRQLFENTDLGYGDGRRLSDRVQHISQAIINHDLGRIIQAEFIAGDNLYNMGFDNVAHWLFDTAGKRNVDFSEIGLGGRIDDIPDGTLKRMRDKFRRILPDNSPLDPNRLQKKHVFAIVDAYIGSVTYRLSATRMWNNHGSDSLAIMDMDDEFIDRFLLGLSPDVFDAGDAEIIGTFLRHEPNRFRMCSVEYKSSSKNRFQTVFFYGNHGKGDFSSYPDELVNTAVQINSVLRRYGILDGLPVVNSFQVHNWDPNVILDFSDTAFYEGGYRRILESDNPFEEIQTRLGNRLKEIILGSGLDDTGQQRLIHDIISEILLPHMRIRQAYYDASVVEEFFLTGEHFVFNPAMIGFSNRRDGHILTYPIDPSNPPTVPVIIDSSKRSSIVLHPDARNFRMDNEQLVFGFDIADKVNPDDNPFKLSDAEILDFFVVGNSGGLRKGSLMHYLESVADYKRAGARSKPLTVEDICDIAELKVLVDRIVEGHKDKTEIVDFLIERQPPHLKNYFCHIILDRLLKNAGSSRKCAYNGNPSGKNTTLSGLASLFINGRHMMLSKVIEAWGSEFFLKQIDEYVKIPTISPVRYDEIIITAKEPLPYNSRVPSTLGKRVLRRGFMDFKKDVQFLVKNGLDIQLADVVDAIAHAGFEGTKRLVVLPDGYGMVIASLADPLGIISLDSGGYLNNVPLDDFDNFRTVMSMVWRNQNYRFDNGADFLRFPITVLDGSVRAIGSQFFSMRLDKSLLEPKYDNMKKIWENFHLYYRFRDGNSRPITEFNKFLREVFNSKGVTDGNFQYLVEFARFGIVKTRFSYTFGILNDYLNRESLETVDRIARAHAISWETIALYEAGGRNKRRTPIGMIHRNGRAIEINDNNRIVWYLDAILSDSFDQAREPILKFKQVPKILTRVAILTGLPLEKVQKGFRLSDARFFRTGLSAQDIEFLRGMPCEVNALFVDIFRKNHMIDQKGYGDIVRIIDQHLVGRYQNPYLMDKLMKDADPAFRGLQIRMLATFLTPPGVWFAPSGRIGVKNVIGVRNDSPIAIHFVDPETVAIVNLNDLVNFIQDTLRQTIDFFRKLACG